MNHDEPLFHYCTPQTFHSIVSRQSIWLSSMTLSNDTQEGRIVRKVIVKLIAEAGMGAEDSEDIFYAVDAIEDFVDGLALCLSEEGDLLSQWRGYANDGQGFSIGFDTTYLQSLVETSQKPGAKEWEEYRRQGMMLKKVLYSEEEHLNFVQPMFAKVLEKYEDLKRFRGDGLVNNIGVSAQMLDPSYNTQLTSLKHEMRGEIVTFFKYLFELKGYAFREEKEWRLLSLCIGSIGCRFRAVDNKIVPYREFPLKDHAHAVRTIYIGPKNMTPISVVEAFVRSCGFQDVAVLPSEATYR